MKMMTYTILMSNVIFQMAFGEDARRAAWNESVNQLINGQNQNKTLLASYNAEEKINVVKKDIKDLSKQYYKKYKEYDFNMEKVWEHFFEAHAPVRYKDTRYLRADGFQEMPSLMRKEYFSTRDFINFLGLIGEDVLSDIPKTFTEFTAAVLVSGKVIDWNVTREGTDYLIDLLFMISDGMEEATDEESFSFLNSAFAKILHGLPESIDENTNITKRMKNYIEYKFRNETVEINLLNYLMGMNHGCNFVAKRLRIRRFNPVTTRHFLKNIKNCLDRNEYIQLIHSFQFEIDTISQYIEDEIP